MEEIICPWTKEEAPRKASCDVLMANIYDQPVSFRMKGDVCLCSVHGSGREYKLEELSSEYSDLVARVRDYFNL